VFSLPPRNVFQYLWIVFLFLVFGWYFQPHSRFNILPEVPCWSLLVHRRTGSVSRVQSWYLCKLEWVD
jgi:hypothetical protein